MLVNIPYRDGMGIVRACSPTYIFEKKNYAQVVVKLGAHFPQGNDVNIQIKCLSCHHLIGDLSSKTCGIV